MKRSYVFFCLILIMLFQIMLAQVEVGREPGIIHANVVSLDQPLIYNRFGSLNPYGMIFALERDIEPINKWTIEGLTCKAQHQLKDHVRPRPLTLRGNVGDILEITFTNLLLDKQPDLSKNCYVEPTSPYSKLLLPEDPEIKEADESGSEEAEATEGKDDKDKETIFNDWPKTRTASFVIQGLTPLLLEGQTNVNPVCLGLDALTYEDSATCRWKLEREGTFLFYSNAAPAGGEGDGGSLVHGLFGTVNVEPKGSVWYRSQVTKEDLDAAWTRRNPSDLTDGSRANALNYCATYEKRNAKCNKVNEGDPVLNFLKPLGDNKHEIIYGDLNAIVHEAKPNREDFDNQTAYDEAVEAHKRAPAFREFTAVFHDELKTFYADAFRELEEYQFEGVGDGFALNYGASGMGSILIANRKGIGASWNCVECMYEEFFLQSWVNGDPALLEQYANDPANVFHSYLNDRVVFRNLHAGPKETHVFHLHSHQWLSASDEDKGNYLDSQTIAPLQGFAYKIYRGGLENHGDTEHDHTQGSGNRNRTPGDSIFHCHLYPHFAQGMWGLWRVHDVIEDGSRTLPDGQPYAGLSLAPVVEKTAPESREPRGGTDPETGENLGGTPIPAVVPLPGQALPPLPTFGNEGFAGYPFYIPAKPGHRAPQPPLDFAKNPDGSLQNAGLERHIVLDGTRGVAGLDAALIELIKEGLTIESEEFPQWLSQHANDFTPLSQEEFSRTIILVKQQPGGLNAWLLQRALAIGDMTGELETANILTLNNDGEPAERRAMAVHAGTSQLDLDADGNSNMTVPVTLKAANGDSIDMSHNSMSPLDYLSLQPEDEQEFLSGETQEPSDPKKYVHFQVNRNQPQAGAPYADPCGDPDKIGTRTYDVSAIQLDMVVNEQGWHDPQARINVLSDNQGKNVHDVNNLEGKVTNEAEPFFFRAASGECIVFNHTNRTPKDLALDDFQMKTPTDIIGQHIHLVKFDVTSSDGSANGFNYEDGTFAADAVLERKCAMNTYERSQGRPERFTDLILPDVDFCDEENHQKVWEKLKADSENFQTTTQRWFADPILAKQEPSDSPASNLHGQKTVEINGKEYSTRMPFTMTPLSPNHAPQDANSSHTTHADVSEVSSTSEVSSETGSPASHEMNIAASETEGAVLGETDKAYIDRTMRTVFTHDHFAPSSIQQHGFYSALLVEPAGSTWRTPDGTPMCDPKIDKVEHPKDCVPPVGPQAMIVNANDSETHKDHREFALAIADFALLYEPRKDIFEVRGMGQLICEAIVAGTYVHQGPEQICPDDVLESLGRENEMKKLNAYSLMGGDAEKLYGEVDNYRNLHGQPVDPPKKPEAISKNHHNPYMVNYRNEPIPLRIGESTSEYSLRCDKEWTEGWEGSDGQIRSNEDIFGLMLRETRDDISRQRDNPDGDLANVFRTMYHGDPCTPILQAYEGEQVQIRLIQGAQEVQHMFTVEDLYWSRIVGSDLDELSREEKAMKDNAGALVATQEIGISEHFEMDLPPLNNNNSNVPMTDYLYHFGTLDSLWNGAWGFIRSYDTPIITPEQLNELRPLSDYSSTTLKVENIVNHEAESACPHGSSHYTYDALAIRVDMIEGGHMYYDLSEKLYDPDALIMLPLPLPSDTLNNWRNINAEESEDPIDWEKLQEYLQDYLARDDEGHILNEQFEPFVLRVSAGDCVTLRVYNGLGKVPLDANGQHKTGDEEGDALMPTIVSLNVDDEDQTKEVTPSQGLAFNIPLVYTDLTDGYLNFGENKGTVIDPGSDRLSAFQTTFYAGIVDYVPAQKQQNGTVTCSDKTKAYPDVNGGLAYCLRATPYAFGPIPIKPFGDVISHGVHGLFGAVIVEPKDAIILDPDYSSTLAEPLRHTLGLEATISYCETDECTPEQMKRFHEFVVFYQDGLNLWTDQDPVANCDVCDDSYDWGEKGLSYRSEPFWARLNEIDSTTDFNSASNLNHAEFPENFFLQNPSSISTPTYIAKEGEEVRFRVVQPAGRARQRAFTVYGYDYEDMMPEFGSPASALMSVGKAITARLEGPDLDNDKQPDGMRKGCYMYRDGPSQFWSGGVWGLFLVQPTTGYENMSREALIEKLVRDMCNVKEQTIKN